MTKGGGPTGAEGQASTGVRRELRKRLHLGRADRTALGRAGWKRRNAGGGRSERAEAEDTTLPRHPGGTHSLHVIEPVAPGLRRTFADAWRHRAAFIYFMRRFLRKRYGRTFLGYLWIFLPVLVPLFMGALVFGGILGVSAGPVPYFLFFVVASSAWVTFASTAYFSTRSLEITRSELRRVYVPRLVPLGASMTLPVINLLIFLVIGAGAVVFYVLERDEFYLALSPATLLVPPAIAMLVLFGLACGLWFSPLAARARDVRRLAGYVLGFWYFLTPVIYPIEEIPANWQFLASLNPVTAPVEIVKAGLIDTGDVTPLGVAMYFVALVVVGGIGLRLFTANERGAVERYY